VIVVPAAFMGGLEGMCQHLEFKELAKRLDKREEA